MPNQKRLGFVASYGLLGAISGAASALIIQRLPGALEVKPLPWLLLAPGSSVPGLLFGLIIGAGLFRRGLLGGAGFAAYTAASTLSYLAAFTLAAEVLLDVFPDTHLLIGVFAGLFGSACLTGLSLLPLSFLRRVPPCLWLLAVGALCGGLLPLVTHGNSVFATLSFFAVWQGGYAAALAAAFPPVRAG